VTVTELDTADFLTRLTGDHRYRDQIVHVRDLPEREAAFGEVPGGLDDAVREALAARGITRLFRHQAEAIAAVREGKSVVVVTGTASGKTLCYQVPVLEAFREEPLSTALCLFPTKALAQDQLRGLESLAEGMNLVAGTYDGDTPNDLRRRLRDRAQVILTNPDMLHAGILPNHARWARFFTHLRYVVVDEVHAYRGVFGSHLANVMRRLRRICAHYGSAARGSAARGSAARGSAARGSAVRGSAVRGSAARGSAARGSGPRFICCSATIANPVEHAAGICGEPVVRIGDDGSPQGPKRFVLWNPPRLGDDRASAAGGDRKSALWEVVQLLTSLVREGIQTIAFTRTRLAAELVMRNTRDLLRPVSRQLAGKVTAYRGGYLPEDRREIERRLAERDILGVASTNALELGIDIGSLDACVILGYPGTIASLWQQAGRAGRTGKRGRGGGSLVFLVGQNTPVDQYLMTHTDWLFGRNPERAVVDPDNPHVAVGHVRCAVHELPLSDTEQGETGAFGPLTGPILELLEEDEEVRRIGEEWYWASSAYPASDVSLRNIAGPVYTIRDGIRDGGRTIGTLDEISALSQLHDHAVYIHGGDTYFVNELDLVQKIARVERRTLDYYTQAVQVSAIRIDETEEEGEWRGAELGYGDVTVTTTIPMFKKVRFHSRESVGFEKLELPPQELETTAMWFSPPPEMAAALAREGRQLGQALIGIANLAVEVAPVFLMCDTQDIGAVVDAKELGRETLFLHDRFPGGMGYAGGCRERFPEILGAALRVIEECACEDGCPSCVGSPVPPFAMSDLDSSVRGRIPDKRAALALLREVLMND